MANLNIQGSVKIDGRGHTFKENRGYVPGEYRKLVNAEIDATGCLINRRPIKAMANNLLDNPYEFIGNWGPWVIANAVDTQIMFNANSNIAYPLWSPKANLTTDGSASSWNIPKKFIRYNNINHWICSRYDNSTATWTIVIAHSTSVKTDVSDASSLHSMDTFANVTQTTVITRLASAGDLDIKDAFVHKDRLWIVCSDIVYFSKPTDFLTFTVPDGGFFMYPEAYLQSGVGNRDSIYIIGNSGVFNITYSTDPNVDAVAREIGASNGGDSCCVYEDTVYFTKDDSLFAVVNSTITKVLDLDLGFYGHSNVYTKLEPFGEYLVMLRWKNRSYYAQLLDEFSEFSKVPALKAKSHPIADFTQEATGNRQYYLYFLNMSTGSIHVVDYADHLDRAVTARGFVGDIFFPPVEDGSNNYHLYLMTKTFNSSSIGAAGYNGESYIGGVYQMPLSIPTYDSYALIDTWLKEEGPYFAWPYVDVEIEGYVPDGNEHFFKKFRSILIQGRFPYSNLTIRFGFDNREYSIVYPLLSDNAVIGYPTNTPNEVMPSRFPINQRARSLHINLKTVDFDPLTLGGSGSFQRFSIEDIRVLYGYSKRVAIARDQGRYIS